MRFISLEKKDVINHCDGKKIGYIRDIEFDCCNFKIVGIYIEKPGCIHLLSLLKGPPLLYIPNENIISIGEDVIIVNIIEK